METIISDKKTKKEKKARLSFEQKHPLPKFDLKRLLDTIQKTVDNAPGGFILLFIDLFCGAGGFSEGAEQALDENGNKCAVIIAGVNHDYKAIYSQSVNHPAAYYSTEDIRIAHLDPIKELVDICRQRWPQCPIYIKAGVDCTSHSGAKGGQSRDNDSRTLAEHLPRYLEVLKPDGLWIENVKEFLDWGPLHAKMCLQQGTEIIKKGKTITLKDPIPEEEWEQFFMQKAEEGFISWCPLDKVKRKKGEPGIHDMKTGHLLKYTHVRKITIPVHSRKGESFHAWRADIIAQFGMHAQHKILNAADYGVPQNRRRLFLYFMKGDAPIAFPKQTHAKKELAPKLGMLPHVAVRECIDFSVEGRSVLDPDFIKSKQSKRRVLNGLIKFVAGGKKNFMYQRNNGSLSRIYSIDDTARTVTTTGGNQYVGTANFLAQSHGGDPASKVYSVDEAGRTVKAGDNQSLATVKFVDNNTLKDFDFIFKYRGENHRNQTDSGFKDIDDVAPTIPTNNQLAVGKVHFMDVVYGNGTPSDINKPSVTARTKDGQSVVTVLIPNRLIAFQRLSPDGPAPVNGDDPAMIINYQGSSDENTADPSKPSNTIQTKEKLAPLWLKDVKYFIAQYYSGGGQLTDVENPADTVLNVPKQRLVSAEPWVTTMQYDNTGKSIDEPVDTVTSDRHYPYLLMPQWGEECAHDIDKPCVTLIARMDKAAPHLVYTELGHVFIPVFDTDDEVTIEIKEFMAMYGISDIKMRMLMVKELKLIQSFPKDYFLAGSQTDQKKFIGNAIACLQAKANVEAMHRVLREYFKERLPIFTMGENNSSNQKAA